MASSPSSCGASRGFSCAPLSLSAADETETPARSPDTGTFVFSDVRLGSRGDSYYEYLSKQYLLTNRSEAVYRDMHDEAMRGVKTHLLKKSAAKGLVYTSELLPRRNPTTGALCVSRSLALSLSCLCKALARVGSLTACGLPCARSEMADTPKVLSLPPS